MSDRKLVSVILIDDERDFNKCVTEIISKTLNTERVLLQSFAEGNEGFKQIEENCRRGIMTIAVIDIILPQINGDVLIEQAKFDKKDVLGFVISAHKTESELNSIAASKEWLEKIYCKPVNYQNFTNELVRYISQYVEREDSDLIESSSALDVGFDYGELDASLILHLKEEATEIKGLIRNTIESTLEAGKRLTEVKRLLPHGKFREWVEKETGFHYTSIAQFMRLWETFGNRRADIVNSGLNVTILYRLASDSVPEDFRQRVIKLSSSGKKISVKKLKQMRQVYDEGIAQKENESQEEVTVNVNTSADIDTTKTDKKPEKKPEIVNVIRKKRFIELGPHLLYCGHPTAREFSDRLPEDITFSIAFPMTSDWGERSSIFPSVYGLTETIFRNNAPQGEEEVAANLKFMRSGMKEFTYFQENILFAFLPYPKLLLMAHELELICWIAEPNLQRCDEIVKIWEENRASR
ncbi:DUF3102 domain-containing protein [Myxosarcina sp. GI1]|uniref:DUF3102 domain-containing protein n=1 Tax=Myxosarcina sp. GI1 TaxID=1541065 RepID=UPI00055EDCA2|nr:DUF3102 domain-containing protein [Myxosarcina sp. GI1]